MLVPSQTLVSLNCIDWNKSVDETPPDQSYFPLTGLERKSGSSEQGYLEPRRTRSYAICVTMQVFLHRHLLFSKTV